LTRPSDTRSWLEPSSTAGEGLGPTKRERATSPQPARQTRGRMRGYPEFFEPRLQRGTVVRNDEARASIHNRASSAPVGHQDGASRTRPLPQRYCRPILILRGQDEQIRHPDDAAHLASPYSGPREQDPPVQHQIAPAEFRDAGENHPFIGSSQNEQCGPGSHLAALPAARMPPESYLDSSLIQDVQGKVQV